MTTSTLPVRSAFLVSEPRCSSACARRSRPGARDACSYQVAWAINPHMRVGSVEPQRAARQHRTLTELLRALGARVERVPFVHAAYDSVFIKDNALLVRGPERPRALLARPRFAERRREQADRQRALLERGFLVEPEASASFEGGDVVMLPDGEGALLGTGFRSERGAAEAIAEFLGTSVHPLELCDPQLYHLDTALTALSDGTIVFCEAAFTPASNRWLERRFGRDALLRVSYDEACSFALNIIQVGRHLILGGPSPRLEGRLRARGWEVHVPDLAQFRRAGGSAACLVAKLHDEPALGASARVACSTAA